MKNIKPIEMMCGGCGASIPCTDSLCEKCQAELHSGKTAWVDETKMKKSKLQSTANGWHKKEF